MEQRRERRGGYEWDVTKWGRWLGARGGNCGGGGRIDDIGRGLSILWVMADRRIFQPPLPPQPPPLPLGTFGVAFFRTAMFSFPLELPPSSLSTVPAVRVRARSTCPHMLGGGGVEGEVGTEPPNIRHTAVPVHLHNRVQLDRAPSWTIRTVLLLTPPGLDAAEEEPAVEGGQRRPLRVLQECDPLADVRRWPRDRTTRDVRNELSSFGI